MKQIFKTTVLLAALTGLFLAVGYMLGGQNGMMIALIMASVMNVGMYWFSDTIVLKMQKAQPLGNKYPEVHTIIQELTTTDNLPMPKLYYVDTPIPNAFATGRSPKHAAVAVTTGIMDILNTKELRAVLAHELGHVKNRDMLVSTIAASVAGAISFIAQMAFFIGGNDEDRPNPIAAMAILILAPLAASLIQMAVSRSREFLADEHSANILHGGNDLASALQKLENFKSSAPAIRPNPNEQATAHLMFANMFSMSGFASLFSTHPSTEARVKRLRNIV